MNSAFVIKILYSAASLQGIFIGVLLYRSKNNQPANRILAVLLSLISCHLILVGFDDRDFFLTFPHLSRISWIVGSLYWPLLFFFVQKTLRYSFPKWMNALLFLPFLFFLLAMLPYYLQSAAAKRVVLDDFEKVSQLDFGWINQTMSILHVVFQILVLLTYNFIERKLKEEYSGDEAIRVRWLKEFLIGILIVTLIAVFSFFARRFEIPLLSSLYHFHFIGLVVLFYWVAFKALTYPAVFGLQTSESAPVPKPETKEMPIEMPDEKLQGLFFTIRSVVENEKLFLKPTLTLTELADRAGIQRNLASQAINTQSGGNFFDLINDFRIAEFKRLVNDPTKKNLSVLGIAQESGFNSKATFYAIFKKKTGMTPSEFVESGSDRIN